MEVFLAGLFFIGGPLVILLVFYQLIRVFSQWGVVGTVLSVLVIVLFALEEFFPITYLVLYMISEFCWGFNLYRRLGDETVMTLFAFWLFFVGMTWVVLSCVDPVGTKRSTEDMKKSFDESVKRFKKATSVKEGEYSIYDEKGRTVGHVQVDKDGKLSDADVYDMDNPYNGVSEQFFAGRTLDGRKRLRKDGHGFKSETLRK